MLDILLTKKNLIVFLRGPSTFKNSNSKIKHITRQEAFGNYKEIERRFADTTKAYNLLDGWKCKTDIIEDIKGVIDDWK